MIYGSSSNSNITLKVKTLLFPTYKGVKDASSIVFFDPVF
jgi:hypothetical protein